MSEQVDMATSKEKTGGVSSSGRLPDFIIGGAMKSGTSQLHALLDAHEDVYIHTLREPQFFALDDFEENPGFFGDGSVWTFRDFEQDYDKYLRWYQQFFADAEPHQLVGEDSTSYLPSRKAPGRIAEMLPEVKLIFTLRNPVARTYSHYWHRLAAGRATYTFQKELRFKPGGLIKRSLYRRQVERYLRHFPREQIKFVIFEDYIGDMQACADELWDFLGLEKGPDVTRTKRNRNGSWYPYFPQLLAWQNGLSRPLLSEKHYSHFTHDPEKRRPPLGQRLLRRLDHRLRYTNLRPAERPPMDPEVKQFLERFFARENAGLSDLIGIDVRQYWPWMNR